MNKSPSIKFIEKSPNIYIIDLILVAPFLLLPLFVDLPYRVNIFLSWEGAYRLYLGQIPFKDFGLPLGFGYWLLPALAFKLFGPTFLSLIKAQVFINLVSILALRGLLYNLKVKPLVVTISILVFCLTYVIYNFWPWYNHSVIVFELVALFFITSYSVEKSKLRNTITLIIGGFFTFVTFFTKQDVGGICFVIGFLMLSYLAWQEKRLRPVLIFIITFIISSIVFIYPFINHEFSYWFNYGQDPHSSRISIALLLNTLLSQSLVEKIYIVLIFGAVTINLRSWRELVSNRTLLLTLFLSVAFICQAIVTRVTSPLPTDHMSYFHVFGFIGLTPFLPWERWTSKIRYVVITSLILIVTFSGGYWKYISGLLKVKEIEGAPTITSSEPWEEGSLQTLKHVLLPPATNEGINSIISLPFLSKENLKVLNLSELTFLAKEIGYTPPTKHPLWYHLNIGAFQKEVEEINAKIRDGYYDLVLFEDIPSLNNFYPYAIQATLKEKYYLYNKFLAPRQLEDSHIEVFIHPDLARQYELKQANDPTTQRLE